MRTQAYVEYADDSWAGWTLRVRRNRRVGFLFCFVQEARLEGTGGRDRKDSRGKVEDIVGHRAETLYAASSDAAEMATSRKCEGQLSPTKANSCLSYRGADRATEMAQRDNNPCWDNLPSVILQEIFSYLSHNSRLRASQVFVKLSRRAQGRLNSDLTQWGNQTVMLSPVLSSPSPFFFLRFFPRHAPSAVHFGQLPWSVLFFLGRIPRSRSACLRFGHSVVNCAAESEFSNSG